MNLNTDLMTTSMQQCTQPQDNIYKWENWDCKDPESIKRLANDPNWNQILELMEKSGHLNSEQSKNLQVTIKTLLKFPEIINAVKEDLQELQKVSKIDIYILGESKIFNRPPLSRFKIAAKATAVGISVFGSLSCAALFSWIAYTISPRSGERGSTAVQAAILFGISGLVGRQAVLLVKDSMIEGYSSKIREIISKHAEQEMGSAITDRITASVKDELKLLYNGNPDKIIGISDAFNHNINAYLEYKIKQ